MLLVKKKKEQKQVLSEEEQLIEEVKRKKVNLLWHGKLFSILNIVLYVVASYLFVYQYIEHSLNYPLYILIISIITLISGLVTPILMLRKKHVYYYLNYVTLFMSVILLLCTLTFDYVSITKVSLAVEDALLIIVNLGYAIYNYLLEKQIIF
jgi:hypothetical protein